MPQPLLSYLSNLAASLSILISRGQRIVSYRPFLTKSKRQSTAASSLIEGEIIFLLDSREGVCCILKSFVLAGKLVIFEWVFLYLRH